jgi:prevent-host-death family protein
MVTKRISVRDARANFSELLGQVYYTKEAVIVERKGKPMAALVSTEELEAIQRIKDRGWAVIDELRTRNADADPDEVYQEVTNTVEEVRQEMYEKRQRGSSKSRH